MAKPPLKLDWGEFLPSRDEAPPPELEVVIAAGARGRRRRRRRGGDGGGAADGGALRSRPTGEGPWHSEAFGLGFRSETARQWRDAKAEIEASAGRARQEEARFRKGSRHSTGPLRRHKKGENSEPAATEEERRMAELSDHDLQERVHRIAKLLASGFVLKLPDNGVILKQKLRHLQAELDRRKLVQFRKGSRHSTGPLRRHKRGENSEPAATEEERRMVELSDHDLQVKVHRIAKLLASDFVLKLPDKGAMLKQKLRHLQAELDRRKLVHFGKEPLAVGPWGGPEGSSWDFKGNTHITQIIIAHGWAIDSLVIKGYSNGAGKWTPKIGGDGGGCTDKVEMDWPDEFLTSIEGYYGNFEGLVTVRSLTFTSNHSTYGPFGRREGTPFSLPVSGGMIIGFHGRASKYLSAIGVYLMPLGNFTVGCERSSNIVDGAFSLASLGINEDEKKAGSGLLKEAIVRWPTLWGGIGGRPWDDGVFTGIQLIILKRETSAVRSIQIVYDRSGTSVYSPLHGGTGGIVTDMIKLDYPNESLISIDGFYGLVEGSGNFEVIKSLTFLTNKQKYGPFGEEIGKFFTLAPSHGIVVGFLGSSGIFLDALGVHMAY